MESNSEEPGPREALRFLDVSFDQDLLILTRDDGSTARLSRKERALLRYFIARPHRLLCRDQLLSAMVTEDADVSDRNVDFLVNRLRRKLRDKANAPRFISTKYGEGYVWIAATGVARRLRGLIGLGPIRGGAAVRGSEPVRSFLQALRRALVDGLPSHQTVVVGHDDGAPADARFSVEIGLVDHGGRLRAAVVLRDEREREWLELKHTNLTVTQAAASDIAADVLQAVWSHLTLGHRHNPSGFDVPLEVRMHQAARLLTPFAGAWTLQLERDLAQQQASHANEPATSIMYAVNLHTRLVRAEGGDPADPATYAKAEAQIESLVLPTLPRLEPYPILQFAAAKMLIAVHRGYEDVAEDLAERGLHASGAFAAALPILAQLCIARGEPEQATAHFDQALSLCEPGSQAELYLTIQWAQTQLAVGGHTVARAKLGAAFARRPALARKLALHMLSPGETLTIAERTLIDHLPPVVARQALGYQYHMLGRCFPISHLVSIMSGPMEHLGRRFGPTIVPEAVRAALSAAAGGSR